MNKDTIYAFFGEISKVLPVGSEFEKVFADETLRVAFGKYFVHEIARIWNV
jgi:hypothetical protein